MEISDRMREVLQGHRVTTWRAWLCDEQDQLVRPLYEMVGGSLECNRFAEIRGGGSLDLQAVPVRREVTSWTDPVEVGRNLSTNPSMETPGSVVEVARNWIKGGVMLTASNLVITYGGGTATKTPVADARFVSGKAMRVDFTVTTPSASAYLSTAYMDGITDGDVITLSFRHERSSGFPNVAQPLYFAGGAAPSGALLGSGVVDHSDGTSTVWATLRANTGGSTKSATPQARYVPPAVGGWLLVGDFQMTKTDKLVPAVFGSGGDDPDRIYAWTGAANASASTASVTRVAGIDVGWQSTQWASHGTHSLRLPDGAIYEDTLNEGETLLITPRAAGQVYLLDDQPHATTTDPLRIQGPVTIGIGPGWWDDILTTDQPWPAGRGWGDGDHPPSAAVTAAWAGTPNQSESVFTSRPRQTISTITEIPRDLDIDWGRARIRIEQHIDGLDDPIPWGVYLPEVPEVTWHDEQGSLACTVSLMDKVVVPFQDQPTETYSLPAGANYVAEAAAILTMLGETRMMVIPSTLTLPADRAWPIDEDTTWGQIINDLLSGANYFSLWCDGDGVYMLTPHRPSSTGDAPAWTFQFGGDRSSLYMPEWQQAEDWMGVPNRVILVSQGDDETPAMVAVATNTNPDSKYSVPRRGGRVITHKETGVEAADQATLDAKALAKLESLTTSVTNIKVDTAPLPLWPNDRVDLISPSRDGRVPCTISSWTLPLEPGGLMSHEWREVVSLG